MEIAQYWNIIFIYVIEWYRYIYIYIIYIYTYHNIFVSLPTYSMVICHSYVNVYQTVNIRVSIPVLSTIKHHKPLLTTIMNHFSMAFPMVSPILLSTIQDGVWTKWSYSIDDRMVNPCASRACSQEFHTFVARSPSWCSVARDASRFFGPENGGELGFLLEPLGVRICTVCMCICIYVCIHINN